MVTPRMTVIIPARNEEHYIVDTLYSLRSQDYPGIYDVLVVDINRPIIV
jgi:glycosyltransferase involved in cell wall biosynthesis